MPESSNVTASRSALLELQDERDVMREGHAFLDEKRTLLASELIDQLKEYYRLKERFASRYDEAVSAVKVALLRHGLDGLQCYPAHGETGQLERQRHDLMGVALVRAKLALPEEDGLSAWPSSEQGEHARRRFRELLADMVALAAVGGNLMRLYDDYVRTERRTRALEDVLIPELDEQIKNMSSTLEAQELEEAVRVRSLKSKMARV